MFIIYFSFFGFHFLFLFFWEFVTRHPPPATRYPSPATRYPSPATRHPRKSPAADSPKMRKSGTPTRHFLVSNFRTGISQ